MQGKRSTFYREVAAMIVEANENLEAYLRTRGDDDSKEVFRSIKEAGYAFLDEDQLKPSIREEVGIRHERQLTNAAISVRDISMLTRAPTSHNQPIFDALTILKTNADRLLREAEHKEALTPSVKGAVSHNADPFVSEKRIEALRQLNNPRFDPARLIKLLEEINVAFANDCFMATAMLTRAVTDHVPSVFGFQSLIHVASNASPANKSFRASMGHLENSLRKIADAHLHIPMRAKESVPERQQVVGFQGDLDVLLGEVIRLLSSA